MFFAKPTYEEITLPFRYVEVHDDVKLGLINIEAYGNILGKHKYCYCCYELKDKQMYQNGDFEMIIGQLKNTADKTVKVMIKVKKGVPKDFTLDINSLAEAFNDERFKSLTLLGRGFNDKSYRELAAK